MLEGLDKKQIRELQQSLDLLPSCFDEIKETIILGCGYWYPLCEMKPTVKTAVYFIDQIYRDENIDLIKTVLEKADISEAEGYHPYCYEGQAKWRHIPDMKQLLYERDETGYIFPWILETYYYDTSHAWIIYISHEGTITFAGEQLAQIAEMLIGEKYRY